MKPKPEAKPGTVVTIGGTLMVGTLDTGLKGNHAVLSNLPLRGFL